MAGKQKHYKSITYTLTDKPTDQRTSAKKNANRTLLKESSPTAAFHNILHNIFFILSSTSGIAARDKCGNMDLNLQFSDCGTPDICFRLPIVVTATPRIFAYVYGMEIGCGCLFLNC